ncbi:MAG: PKD domain-containing protein [Candidatus Krumholzibacteriota bacterium]|nr:PKD domain-containing protein [Candidatus Krumholzibacteriota bacterium]
MNTLSGTAPLTVAFTNLSTGVLTSYSWNFGDGRNSSLRDPVHTYADPDTYTVSLTVTGPGGTDIETKLDYIDVRPRPNPPVVDFVGQPTSGYAPLTVTFIDLATGSVDSVRWDFGDGGTSTDRDTLTHEYQNPGTYTVQLVAYGEDGTDQKIRTDYITVNQVPDILAEFYALPLTGVAPLSVTFTDQSFGLIDTWKWYFDDGDSSAVENPIHTYTSSGVYTVTLTVEGQSGTDTEVKTDYIVVLKDAPTILSMVDVPNDQGGWLYLAFARSGYDYVGEAQYPVANYFVFRRVDDPMLVQAVHEQGNRLNDGDEFTLQTNEATITSPASRLGGEVLRYADRYYVTGNPETGSAPSGTWAVVAGVPAHQQDDYIALVPTVADSTPDTLIYSVYMVSAETTTPSVFFFSAPDSGYSVDNIAPGVPQAFAVAYNTGSGNQLSWDPAPEPDFQYFKIYRNTDPSFTPGPGNLVDATAATNWTDPDFDGGMVYYQITAVDDAGNESDPASPGTAETTGPLRVPANFSTIQAAINAALPGDTVLVASGTYTGVGNKNLDFGGKGIVLLSESEADSTIIDCEGSGRGIWFHSGEDTMAIMDGFTITNGSDSTGGGIRITSGSSPQIRGCRINGNTAVSVGGGIVVLGSSSPRFTECDIVGNQGSFNGAVYISGVGTSPRFTNCRIAGNAAADGGGVFVASSSTPTFTDCTIVGNDANAGGGGLYVAALFSAAALSIHRESVAQVWPVTLASTSSPTRFFATVPRVAWRPSARGTTHSMPTRPRCPPSVPARS